MNETDVINAYVRELKLATFRENAEPSQDAVREPRCCLTTSRSEQERRLPLLQPTCLSPDGRKC